MRHDDVTAQSKGRTRLGVEAENMGQPALLPGIVAMARASEESGSDSVSVSDHLLSFTSPAGSRSAGRAEIWLEALSCLAAISSITSRVKLIASVIILPQRNVLELMKTVATLDVLSEGRLVLGVGSGWNAQEMTALGYDFGTRGQRMDEMLHVMRSPQGTRVPGFSGGQVHVPEGIVMSPSSWPGHSVPIYIGGAGVSKPSLRRALAFGDGWMPYSPVGQYDPAVLRRTLHDLHEERALQGRRRLDSIFKLSVPGHADPGLERSAVELASVGFDEIIIQGIWDAGLEPGIAAIARVRAALDA